jgi:hypothetical protein
MAPSPQATPPPPADPVIPYASPDTPRAGRWFIDYVPVAQRFLLQAAHRLVALAIWLLAARLALAIFDYDAAAVSKLLPWAMTLLNAALVFAFAAYWIARVFARPRDESRWLLAPTLILIALTAAWMLIEIARAP